LHLTSALAEDLRIPFIDMLVMHPNVEPMLVASLVSDGETFAMFPRPGDWVGHAVWRRGVMLMQDSSERRLEIEELIPLGIIDGSARSLLGSALDSGRLTENAIDKLMTLFPEDRYFKSKLGSTAGRFG
jgi:hypothetical protein